MLTNLVLPDPKLLESARRVTLEEDRIGVMLGLLVPRHIAREEQAVADVTAGFPFVHYLNLGRRNFCLNLISGFVVSLNRLTTNMDRDCRRLAVGQDDIASKELQGDKLSNVRLWDLLATELLDDHFHQLCDAGKMTKLDGDLFPSVVVTCKHIEGEHSGMLSHR